MELELSIRELSVLFQYSISKLTFIHRANETAVEKRDGERVLECVIGEAPPGMSGNLDARHASGERCLLEWRVCALRASRWDEKKWSPMQVLQPGLEESLPPL